MQQSSLTAWKKRNKLETYFIKNFLFIQQKKSQLFVRNKRIIVEILKEKCRYTAVRIL